VFELSAWCLNFFASIGAQISGLIRGSEIKNVPRNQLWRSFFQLANGSRLCSPGNHCSCTRDYSRDYSCSRDYSRDYSCDCDYSRDYSCDCDYSRDYSCSRDCDPFGTCDPQALRDCQAPRAPGSPGSQAATQAQCGGRRTPFFS
jgi:hypothetical protein